VIGSYKLRTLGLLAQKYVRPCDWLALIQIIQISIFIYCSTRR